MAILVGIVLALVVGVFARVAGFDRDRAFYPTVVIVVASYYDLFAVMAGRILGLELLGTAAFVVAAVLGLRRDLWIAAAALAAHGLFDVVHPHVFTNPGVPAWWPAFCSAYDVTAAAWLAWSLHSGAMPRRLSN